MDIKLLHFLTSCSLKRATIVKSLISICRKRSHFIPSTLGSLIEIRRNNNARAMSDWPLVIAATATVSPSSIGLTLLLGLDTHLFCLASTHVCRSTSMHWSWQRGNLYRLRPPGCYVHNNAQLKNRHNLHVCYWASVMGITHNVVILRCLVISSPHLHL